MGDRGGCRWVSKWLVGATGVALAFSLSSGANAGAAGMSATPPRTAAVAAKATVVMRSDPGDFLGDGQDRKYTNKTATISLSGNLAGLQLNIQASNGDTWFVLLYPSWGDILAPGTYAHAATFPGGRTPGLDASGLGRGCNRVTGSFTITKVVFSPTNGSVQQFDGRFVQHCEGAKPALHGSITFAVAPSDARPHTVAAGHLNAVTMVSGVQDSIGGGLSQEFDDTNATIAESGGPAELNISVAGGTEAKHFNFDIAPPAGKQLAVGYYADAQQTSVRAAGHAGIDITGDLPPDAPPCNDVSGRFAVTDVAYSAGSLTRLTMLYEEKCVADLSSGSVFGEIRIGENASSGLTQAANALVWPDTSLGVPSTVAPLYIRNTGGVAAHVTGTQLVGSDPTDFLIRSDQCSGVTLGADEGCPIYVRFAPTRPGPRSAELHVTTTTGDLTFQLDGTGAVGTSLITLTSPQGDYIGQGQNYRFTNRDATTRVSGTDQHASFDVNTGAGEWWSIDFAPAPGGALQPGEYTHADEYPSGGPGPALSIESPARACDTINGSFDIQQAVFSPADDTIEHFAATFSQSCDGTDPPLTGSITFNASTDLKPPAPVTALHAQRAGSTIQMTWTNPTTSDYSYTVMRGQQGTKAPATPTTGDAIFSGVDTQATAPAPSGPYSIAIFTVDERGNAGAPTTATIN